MTKTITLLTTGLLLAATNVNASAKTHFETRICRACDYNHALATATALKPMISATDSNATPVKILVVDADTRIMWGFDRIYDNQVAYLPNLPDGTETLVNQLLNSYQAVHGMAVEITEELAKENSQWLSRTANDDLCKNSGHKEALDAVFSPLVRNQIQRLMQAKSYKNPNFIANMSALKMDGMGFNASNTTVSLGGSWQGFSPSTRILKKYGPQDTNRPTEVGFTANVINKQVVVRLSDIRTYFDGISLKSIQSQTTSASLYSECMVKAMDDRFPKVVASAGAASWNNIALVGGGMTGTKDDDDRRKTCKHTYYHNSAEIASFAGKCL
ncbi:MAG: hypothetical protein MJK04_12860 [Psychrosphaera sp.]|nr:hypothetical protein [Psychrosphaera sp.]